MTDTVEQDSNVVSLTTRRANKAKASDFEEHSNNSLTSGQTSIRTVRLKDIVANARKPKYQIGQIVYAAVDLGAGDPDGGTPSYLECMVTGIMWEFDYVGYHLGFVHDNGTVVMDAIITNEEDICATPYAAAPLALPTRRPRLTLIESQE